VLEFTPDLPTGGGSNALTKGQNALVKLFDEMAENGEIERDILRDSYFDRFDNGNRDSTKRKFNRDIRALIEDEVLVQRNGIISRAYDEND
jgi:polyhydroxyalkanoate synthesis regulator phasin